jgi:hypothetical protein
LPGPVDSELVSLAPGQSETISSAHSAAVQFAVAAINTDRFPSAAAADRARRSAAPAGSELLAAASLSALSLFQYDPGAGAVVDMRNLTVGGS